MMKGAVDYVAGEMGNSKFTIYAYMREVERESSASDKTREGGGAQ
jgi:predicted transcriptional regulator YheO